MAIRFFIHSVESKQGDKIDMLASIFTPRVAVRATQIAGRVYHAQAIACVPDSAAFAAESEPKKELPVLGLSRNSVCKVCGVYENSCDLCRNGMRVEAFVPSPRILGSDGVGFVSIEQIQAE